MSRPSITSRRMFLQSSVCAAAALSVPGVFASCIDLEPDELPTIELPGTGRVLPRLGFGGFPVSRVKDVDEAVRIVRRAIDIGMRYFDTAPSYGNGRSEERIGRAIEESKIKRDELFIATKTLQRGASGARRELEESLKRLRTDYVDSVQVHEVHNDVEKLFAANSVLNELEKAREEGLVKHISITAHRDPKWVIEAIKRYGFATALVPINPIDRQHLSFIDKFLPVAKERGVGVIAMKVFAGGAMLKSGNFKAGELLRYALSQPYVHIAVPGCEAVEHVDEAYEAIKNFKPLTDDEKAELEKRAGTHKGKTSEWYKDEKDGD